MTILTVVRTLNELGIFPYLEDGKLKTRSDAPISDSETVALIRAHRDELIGFLAGTEGEIRQTTPIVPIADRAAPTPLSFAQQRLWFIHQLEGGSSQYNININLVLRGALDMEALRRTIDTIVARHETLRTRFIQDDKGEVLQLPAAAGPVPVPLVELDALPEQARWEAVAEHSRAESACSFDLGDPLLLRVMVLRVSSDEYVVLFVTHHIASDGWSKDVLVDEFCRLYAAFHAHGENPLPPLPIQYRDYAAWQREKLTGQALETQLSWWMARLAGLPPVHALPLSWPRPAQQRFEGGMLRMQVPEATVHQARAWCITRGMTPFVLMHAAFALLLGRMGGEYDVAVGTPVSGRVHPDLEHLVGFFINTLVLRTRIDPAQDFHSYVNASKRDVLDAFSRQTMPFELLVDAINPERSLSYSPLFQLLFSYHSGVARDIVLPDLQVDSLEQADSTNQFDMEFNVADDGDRMQLGISYNTTLFDAGMIAQLASNFCVLLAAGLQTPGCAVADLPLLDDAQRLRMLERNHTDVVPMHTGCVHACLSAMAAARPDLPAVVAADGELDLLTLECVANRLAHYLVERGVRPGDRVGICLRRSLDLPVALLAVLKAGGAYVPMAPETPESRLLHMIEDASIQLVLTHSELWDALYFGDSEAIPMDLVGPMLEAQPESPPDVPVDANAVAYVLYTSGSTGQPKGVAVPHRALMNYLDYAARQYFSGDIGGGVVATPFAFDATVTTLIAPWFAGLPSCLLDDEAELSLEQLLEYATRSQPMLFKLTPAHLDALAHLSRQPVSNTRHVLVVGGEQLAVRVLERFRARVLPNAVVANEYGPTETTVGCSIFLSQPHEDIAGTEAVPIGRPIQNTMLYVLDAHGQPVPDGVIGELYIAGAGVADGYLNQDALTCATFVPNPFSGEGRMYRSGDMVRWRRDGELEFIGRADGQVKLNGFRIEPGEIEANLLAHAAVESACVMVHADNAGTKRLVAYVVPSEAGPAGGQDESELERWRYRYVHDLRAAARGSLPDYMLPAAYVLLGALPLTANGKVDRTGLPAPVGEDFEKEAFAAARTSTEMVLLETWRRLLQLDTIGIDDHFFRIGGHSLLATRVVGEIAERLRRRVPVRSMFEYPTVRELAAHIDAQSDADYLPIERVPHHGVLPLSYGQQRLWFIDQFGGGSRQYHISSALRLTGALDRDALQGALDAIVARHETLRSRFVAVAGVASQIVDPPMPVRLRTFDLAKVPQDLREAQMTKLVADEVSVPFDLATDPMLRVLLVRMAEDEHVLGLTMHHIASDGWSTGVLVRDFARLYAGLRNGASVALPPLAIQYGDFVYWQRRVLSPEALRPQLAYWKQQLGDLPRVHGFPMDRARPSVQDYAGAAVERRVNAVLSQTLNELCIRQNASMFMLLRAAFALLISRWSGEHDIAIASPSAGRTRRELEPLVGFFINSLILRTDLSGNDCFRGLLDQVRRSTLDAFAHQAVPFDMLVDELKPERSLNHAPLAQISFTLHNLEDARLELPGLALSHVDDGDPVARFDIELHVFEIDGELHTRWIYATSLFDAGSIERLADSFAVLLDSIAQAPDQPVMTLPLLPPPDVANLEAWSGPEVEALPPGCAHHLFEAHAAQTPQALAVASEGQRLCYAELNTAANQVAHWLRGQGVGRGHQVGLCVERSPEMLVGLLGILKAGAAYVPMDPAYPQERLEAMLSTAGVELVLTQQCVLETLPLLGERTVLPLDGQFRKLLLSGCSGDNPTAEEVDVEADDAAYTIFTSGSTGVPKGVLIAHRGMVNLAAYQRQAFALDTDSRVMTFASICFDGAVFEWLMALASGGSLHICRDDDRKSAQRLAAFLVSERITHGWIPPALLAQVPMDRDYALRVLIVAGEACEEGLAWRWAERCHVVNSYGPSEATVAATHADVLPGRPIMLGRALPNVELRVVNAVGQPQPVGVAGELWLGGTGLAIGYLGLPALSAERFVPNPDGEGRLYRTGDLVRWNSAGELQFLGRVDDQVKVRGFRIELGEVETHLLAHFSVREAVAVVREDTGDPRLAAYVVCDQDIGSDEEALLARTLREHMKARVPDYMVPSAFVLLTAIPLTSNGKVDKRRLPKPDYEAQQVYVAPSGEVEIRLAEIWQQVLRVEQIGVNDNFFEIGGDSILSIQVVSRAKQAGIAITTKQLFKAQSVAELAKLAATNDVSLVSAPQESVQGDLPLLPIHRLFLDAESRDPQHYNQAVLLMTPRDHAMDVLPTVVEALYRRHDALRLRFRQEAGQWRAAHSPLDAVMIADSCIVEPLPEAGADFEERLAARCTHWQRAFDLAAGPLLRAVHFQSHDIRPGRLLLIVHHIVVDGVSWRILLSDLERAYEQCRAGQAVMLDAKTSSFQQWSEAMSHYATSQALHAERGFWLSQAKVAAPLLPVDRRIDGFGQIASTRTLAIGLDEEHTQALLQHCNAAYRTRINELLLAGVYLGMRAWTGETTLRIRLEGHGRESLFDHLDTTSTVGWFTSVYPLTLSVLQTEIGATIKVIKEQYRAIPNNGIGYGALRYLARDAELTASDTHVPELEFNYLGQFDNVLNHDTVFQPAIESVGEKISGRRCRMHQIGLSGKVFGGCLSFVLDYSDQQYDEATMQRLADLISAGWTRVIAHCLRSDASGFTPSDFPLASVGQDRLDAWNRRYPSLTRLYPATPMQAGLHFESQIDPSTYVVQTSLTFHGVLDAAAFRRAWQGVVNRHDILRTALVDDEETLYQAVSAQAELPWHEEDWRSLPIREREARLEAYHLRDREQGLDFEQAPLMRVAMFRVADDCTHVLWTTHHAIVDGWSSPLIQRDVIALYRAEVAGYAAALPNPQPYERYIEWLQHQDDASARMHWQAMLGEVEVRAPLSALRHDLDGDPAPREYLLELGQPETAALHRLAQRCRVTPNTVVQWAWAYLLHRYSGAAQVVFGATISGRSPEVAGIEEMVGLFINTVPVSVAFSPGLALADALHTLQHDFQACSDHGHLPLADIQRLSGVPAGMPLFDSLLVFENLAINVGAEAEAMSPALQVEFSASQRRTQYTMTLIATLDERLRVRMGYRADQLDDATVTRLAGHFASVLSSLPALASDSTAAPSLLDAQERRLLTAWQAPVRAYAQNATIHGLFEARADRHPDAVALIHGEQQMRYGELERSANRVAQDLASHGIGRGQAVALFVDRSPSYVVGLLGILKSGAAYLPIDIDAPAARIAAMLRGSDVRCVLTLPALTGDSVLDGIEVMLLDSEPASSDRPAGRLDAGVDIDDLAFVMHTSGSTGEPKGVQLSHRTIVNLMASMAARYPSLAEPSPSLQFASIGFDMSLYEVAGALFSGGPLVLLGDDDRLDTRRLLETMRSERVARAYLPTAMIEHFAQTALEVGIELPDLKWLQVAGEQLVVSNALRVWATRSGCRLLNLYGPTESHVVSEHALDGNPAAWPSLPPIGLPIDNVVLQIVDAAGQPAPIGVVGELYIGGDGLARGYVGRADLTAERFVTLPIDDGQVRRFYRSGDLARWRADGRIQYMGRADRQVKVRGFRIEPAEIEARLCDHPSVSNALVIPVGDGADRRLVAYVAVGDAEQATLVAEVRALLQCHLPHFMMPSAFMVVPVLPLTANGKVDRRALPVPEGIADQARVEPATDTERRLAAIWEQLLGVQAVGATDRFFELGGHSLLAMRMLSKVALEFGFTLKIKDVFAYQSVALLAQLIDALTAGLADASANEPERDDEALEETEW